MFPFSLVPPIAVAPSLGDWSRGALGTLDGVRVVSIIGLTRGPNLLELRKTPCGRPVPVLLTAATGLFSIDQHV